MIVSLNKIVVNIPNTQQTLFKIKELAIKKGARVLIKGRSGVGKTTLLHLIAGLFNPEEGNVIVDGKNLIKLSDSEKSVFRRENIGIIFQKLNLIDHLTVTENVMLGSRPSEINENIIDEKLKRMDISDKADELTSNLSLGEQQRAAIARILSSNHKLVLADEPTSSLDDDNADKVLKGLLDLEKDVTLITVSHDHRIISGFDQIINFEELNKR